MMFEIWPETVWFGFTSNEFGVYPDVAAGVVEAVAGLYVTTVGEPGAADVVGGAVLSRPGVGVAPSGLGGTVGMPGGGCVGVFRPGVREPDIRALRIR